MSTKQIAMNRILGLAGMALLLSTGAWAAENSYVPTSGGYWNVASNWSLGRVPDWTDDVVIAVSGSDDKTVTYNYTGDVLSSITVDGSSAGYYGAIWHLSHALFTDDMYLSVNGDAWHWMEGAAYLEVTDDLYVGDQGTHTGYFYMATMDDPGSGLVVGDLCYVGYSGPGDFDHVSGIADLHQLYVGQNAPGTYALSSGDVMLSGNCVIGNADVGTFEQTGGSVEQAAGYTMALGLNTGGYGTYLMQGGELDVNSIGLSWNGDGFFTQTGGTVTTTGSITIGHDPLYTYRAWYKLDGAAAVLNVGGSVFVGSGSPGKYEQTGGTATIDDDLKIYKDPDSGVYSYVYLGANAGELKVLGEVLNDSGYYDQDGGIMTTSDFTNDSPQGVNVDNNADFRARNVEHNAGTFYMWRDAIVRGPLAFPPNTFWVCNFTNNATFRMGSTASDGGTFSGILTNNGTFNYYQGDFSSSTLTNQGTLNLYSDLTCRRFVNNTTYALPPGRTITADGAGYSHAVESNGDLTMAAGSQIDVTGSKMINYAPMFAGGPGTNDAHIEGDFDNYDYLIPCEPSLPAGRLTVGGDFSAFSGAQLRIRISGSANDEHDSMSVYGTANLAGELAVELTNGFVPSLGYSAAVMRYSALNGRFSHYYLPTLPNDWMWDVDYESSGIVLTVVEPPACQGDLDGDNDIDLADLQILLANYGSITAEYEQGDLDLDDDIDLADLQILLSVYGQTCN